MLDTFIDFTDGYIKGFTYGINSNDEEIEAKGNMILEACSKHPELPDCAGFISGYTMGKKKLEEKNSSGELTKKPVNPN